MATKTNKIKISQLELESNLKEEALIPIVQDNNTKAIKSKDLFKEVNTKIKNISNREIEFQINNGYMQWKYKNDTTWNNLVSMNSLKGEQGVPGPRGPQGEKGVDGVSPNTTEFENRINEQYSRIESQINIIKEQNVPVTTPIIDNTLALTTHKYQKANMQNNTNITLPSVDKYTEIHLRFATAEELTLVFPNIKWQNQPAIEPNKVYEFIFTYDDEWLGGYIAYE